MDINEAALKLKKIEVIEMQIIHLRSEASGCLDRAWQEYAKDCNEKAQELCRMLELNSFFQ